MQIRPEMLSPRRGKDLNGQCALASPSEGRLVIYKHPSRRLNIKDTQGACVNCEVVKRKFAHGRSKCPLTHSKPFTATMRACVWRECVVCVVRIAQELCSKTLFGSVYISQIALDEDNQVGTQIRSHFYYAKPCWLVTQLFCSRALFIFQASCLISGKHDSVSE